MDHKEITHNEGVIGRIFARENFIYAPQTKKPCREANYPIYYGRDMSRNNPKDQFYILFIDLGVGAIFRRRHRPAV